jgi:hypothetical protein
MSSELAEFYWDVAGNGYWWVPPKPSGRSRSTPDPLLTPCPVGPPRTRVTRYTPLDRPALFRDFADTSRMQEGVLRFANRYGLLGKGTADESFSLWQREITAMRQAVDLWALHQAGDQQGLARHITWHTDVDSNDLVQYQSEPVLAGPDEAESPHTDDRDVDPETGESPDLRSLSTTAVIAAKDHHPEWLERFRPGDVFLPALVFIQRRVNDRLHELVSPRMLYDVGQDRMALRLVPATLLGALWLQFSEAVTEDRKHQRCMVCSSWFEIRPPATRSTRMYCSNTCRIRAQRSRSAQARQLRANGKSVRQIARELGTDVSTVKRWISGDKGG